jgi:hypothetical protein
MSRFTIRGRRWPSLLLLAVAAVATGSVLGAARDGDAAIAVVPTNQVPPVVTGTPKVGETLTTTNGTWTGTAPITFTYQWSRCDENGGSCAAISGATNNTYVLKQVDSGNTLRSTVSATNTDGTRESTSVPTAVVTTAAVPAPTGCPGGTGSIDAKDVSSPARLSIDQQVTSPALITSSTNQVVAHFRVTACNGRPVQNALVLAQVVPFDQFAGPEGTTAADGTVNITLNRQKGFPASRKQQLLVMFVRARKAGEDALAGISTRRLVSFPVALSG